MKGKRILILGASDFQLPAVLKAKEMGLTVGVVDQNKNAVAIPFADYFYPVSTVDEGGVLEVAREFKADGIVTLCTDMPMRALANACEVLGLIGLDYKSAIKSTDKGEMIKAFDHAGVSHPQYIIANRGSLNKEQKKELKYPVITKPTDNSGSRGIMFCSSEACLDSAIAYSSLNGRHGDVIIEECMNGPEVSVELMVIDGEAHVLQITDKLTTGAPHYVEIGHSQPSRLSAPAKEAIANLAKRAAFAVGIHNGPGHAEIILTKEGPKMVEIGARMGGGCITTHLVPYSTGIDMTKATIDVALGNKPNISQVFERGAAIRFIIPPVGKVKSITGKEDAEHVPDIKVVEIQCNVGQDLTELESGASRIGYVIAQSVTPEKAVEQCEKALECIKIEVK